MPGIVYIDKSSNTISLTNNLYNCPTQNKKLIIRTGLQNNATIGYGLTLDATASRYSPLALRYTNSKVCFIGTYSTGSSTYESTYAYTADAGYYTATTKTIPITERRTVTGTDSSESSWQESGTEQYTHHYDTSPAYFKSIYWNTLVYYSYISGYLSQGADVLYNVDNPQAEYGQTFDRITLPTDSTSSISLSTTTKFITTELYPYTYSYGDKSTISRGTKVTETYKHDPNKDGYNIASRLYYATSSGIRESEYYTRLSGRVESGQTAVTSVSSTYTTLTTTIQIQTESYYTETVGSNYETTRYYTERIATATDTKTSYWTDSNINV